MKFKDSFVEKGYDSLHPILKSLIEAVDKWCIAYDGKEITLTDTLSNPQRDKDLGRVSAAHSEGRAVDIRTNDMSKDKVSQLVSHFNTKFLHLGYMSFSGVKRLMRFKDNPPHIHMAIGINVIEQNKNKYEWEYPQHKSRKVKDGSTK